MNIQHLVSGADVLLTVHINHSGKHEEASVVKVILDPQVVAVSEKGRAQNRVYRKCYMLFVIL